MPPRGKPARKSNDNSPYHRGGINKRRLGQRIEKDGDLIMGDATENKNTSSQRGNRMARGTQNTRNTSPRQVAKALRRGENARSSNTTLKTSDALSSPVLEPLDRYDEIVVRGWQTSEAAKSADQGVAQLLSFINRKASKDAKNSLIQEHSINGDNLIIYTNPCDREKILRVNNFQFARSTLSIELKREGTAQTQDVKEAIKAMVLRRFDEAKKLLDLSNLGADATLLGLNMFATQERVERVFPVIFAVCKSIWPNFVKRNRTIQSLSLAANGAPSVTSFGDLPQIFPRLRNLDLSGNNIADLKSLEPWSKKLGQLDMLILQGNAIEMLPDFHLEVMKWYPKLRIIDAVQIRTDEQVAELNKRPQKSSDKAESNTNNAHSQFEIPIGLAAPAGFALSAPEKSSEQLQQELMVLEVCKITHMDLSWSFQCLTETSWNLENAIISFNTNKDKIPADAFW